MQPDSAVVTQPPWVLEGAEELGDDPMLEVLDGPRVVEITTLLGDSVLSVRQLHPRASGVIRLGTWALLLAGGVAVTAGGWLQHAWRPGEGALAVLLGVVLLVLGGARAGRQGRSPHFLVGPARGGTHLCFDDPALPEPRFPLVRCRPWGHELLFAPGMQGEVQQGGKISRLIELRRGGQAWPCPNRPGVWCWPIPRAGRVALNLGAVTVLIRSLAPTRRLPRRLVGRGERASAPYLLGALLLHAVPLLLGLTAPLWWEGAAQGGTAARGEAQRLETILALVALRPPAARSALPPPGVPVHGVAERLPESAQGQVHTPPPGNPSFIRSQPSSRGPDGLYILRGPKDHPDPTGGSVNRGILALLSQQSGSRLLDGLLSQQIGPPGDHRGLGLGLRGVGVLTPAVVTGRGEVRGSLDRMAIRRVIRRHINEVKYCHQKELQVSPPLSSKIVISFTIGSAGVVTTARVRTSTVGDPRVEQCIVSAVRRWRFPRPHGGGPVSASYPFTLTTAAP